MGSMDNSTQNHVGLVGLKEVGQALLETALIAPLLIFMLIGVFEVGWALRGYLLLANANREAARFAVRPHYVEYDMGYPDFMPIANHFKTSLSGQVPFFEQGGTLIVSRLKIDTQMVCKLKEKITDPPCDCELAKTQPFSPTLFSSSLDIPTYTFTFPLTSTEQTRIDNRGVALIAYNREHNCKLFNAGAPHAIDDVITVEFFFHQPQLFGFPLISNPFTDPVPFYGHATFRKISHRE